MFAELESLLLAAAASPAAVGCGGKAKRILHALAKTRHSKRFQDSLSCADVRRPHGGLQFMVWKMHGLRPAVYPLIKVRHAPCSQKKKKKNLPLSSRTQWLNMEVMLLSCFAAINSTLQDCALFLYSSPKARRPLIHFASSILKSLKSERWLKG